MVLFNEIITDTHFISINNYFQFKYLDVRTLKSPEI